MARVYSIIYEAQAPLCKGQEKDKRRRMNAFHTSCTRYSVVLNLNPDRAAPFSLASNNYLSATPSEKMKFDPRWTPSSI